VAYGGGKFVVVGSLGKIATSTNGTSWQAVSDSKFSNDSALYDKISGVVYGGGKFVAFGQKLDGSPSHEVGYSADGETWTLIDGDSWVAFPANGTVAYGGN
jgi:hypothetical protein